ncbi:hypothetical protein PS425_07270 [Limosilactobacillus fermentum]|uniref:hypothetical protein n=1 Tax=Limosilactobacillus fermentum TaxID=1613 RepID=UPI002F26AE2D
MESAQVNDDQVKLTQAQAAVSAASTAVNHIQESASGASVTVTAAQANQQRRYAKQGIKQTGTS